MDLQPRDAPVDGEPGPVAGATAGPKKGGKKGGKKQVLVLGGGSRRGA
jgi:hypothetical protein